MVKISTFLFVSVVFICLDLYLKKKILSNICIMFRASCYSTFVVGVSSVPELVRRINMHVQSKLL